MFNKSSKSANRIVRSLIVLTICTASVFTLTACNGRQIFRTHKDPYLQEPVSAEDLVNDKYYAKSGTQFVPVSLPEGTTVNPGDITTQPKNTRMAWFGKDENLVPTMYKGDVLALKSKSTDLQSVTLERYMDIGYSIGIHGAVFDGEKITLDYDSNIGKNSPAAYAIDGKTSKNIEILAINGKNVTAGMLDSAGVLTCFEKGSTYQLDYNTGTTYKTTKVTAAAHTIESWEIYQIEDIEMTKRGYLQINLPEDLKSGWYFVQGQGFIKYIDHEKGAGSDPTGVDMNQKYYSSDAEQRAAYSQVFSVTFEKRTLHPTIEVLYDKASLQKDETIDAVLLSPDGTQYVIAPGEASALDKDVDTDKKDLQKPEYLICDLQEAIAGKWGIYIAPKTLNVAKVKVLSNNIAQEAREDEIEVSVTKDLQNMTFYVDYTVTDDEKEPYVNGVVIYPDKSSYSMIPSKLAANELVCNVSYLPVGTYTIKFYHYYNVEVGDSGVRENTDVTGTEIISVTE